jgi:hypothetical protein
MEEHVGTEHTNYPTLFWTQSLIHVHAMGLTCFFGGGQSAFLRFYQSVIPFP